MPAKFDVVLEVGRDAAVAQGRCRRRLEVRDGKAMRNPRM